MSPDTYFLVGNMFIAASFLVPHGGERMVVVLLGVVQFTFSVLAGLPA